MNPLNFYQTPCGKALGTQKQSPKNWTQNCLPPPSETTVQHKEARQAALESFSGSSNYGTNFVACNSSSLARDIDEKFAYYRELNASKKLSKRLLVTLEQLSDNDTYREFWRSPRQQQALGGGLGVLLLIRLLLGS